MVPARHWQNRRHRPGRLAALVATAWLSACHRAAPEVALDVAMQPDGSATISVAGPAGRQVAVVANRPWRGEEPLYAGLAGMRCAPEPDTAERAAGAGHQLIGVLGDQPLRTTLPPERLRSLPSPGVLQAVAVDQSHGDNRMSLSNAFAFERGPAGPVLVPFTAWHGLAACWPSLLWFVALPIALVVGLRLGWRRPAPRWLLPGLTAAAIVAHLLTGAGWSRGATWPPPDELLALERHYGEGLAELVRAARTQRRADERITVLVAADRVVEQQSLAAHLVRLLPGTVVVTAPSALPTTGLGIVLGATTEASSPLVPHVPAGRALCTTKVAVLWRLGAQ
ncbi:MAG: hypothetical protein MUC36_26865 [Planctomycetes bacterium]|jgi:hypothetical protein|nr:hypothetical protein [Planctomycetota bacterium]